jgi:hypothetical protein
MVSLSFLAAGLTLFSFAAKPADAALPAYLGDFGTVRDGLSVNPLVLLYTFDQHECSEQIFTDKSVKNHGNLVVNPARHPQGVTFVNCVTGTGAFDNIAISPGYKVASDQTDFTNNNDGLIAQLATGGFSSTDSIFTTELWLTVDPFSGTSIIYYCKYMFFVSESMVVENCSLDLFLNQTSNMLFCLHLFSRLKQGKRKAGQLQKAR